MTDIVLNEKVVEKTVSGMLRQYDAAVQAAVGERRLLVLECLRAPKPMMYLPEDVLRYMFDLANLTYS